MPFLPPLGMVNGLNPTYKNGDDWGMVYYSGWWFQPFFIFHFIYGMSSFPLTNSIIFQDGHIAPPVNNDLTTILTALSDAQTKSESMMDHASALSAVLTLIHGCV